MSDLSRDEIMELITLAIDLKRKQKAGIDHKELAGKTLGMIFEKSSTRTRVSFEVGMYQLGGYPLCLNSRDLQLGRGEPITDTAKVLGRYLDGIMIRTFAQETVDILAEHSGIPVINGLTDYSHPCQVLADLMTVYEYKGSFDGLKAVYIGDGNNMANSLAVGFLTMGMEFALGCHKNYPPDERVLEFAKDKNFTLTDDIYAAAKDADVIITDVFASMGQEGESDQRLSDFKGFCVDKKLMSVAKPDAMVLHCLPAHRDEEISTEVFETHEKEIFDEAENRLHAQKAVLVKLLKK